MDEKLHASVAFVRSCVEDVLARVGGTDLAQARVRREAAELEELVAQWAFAEPDEAERLRVLGVALRLVDAAAALASASIEDAPTVRDLPDEDDDE